MNEDATRFDDLRALIVELFACDDLAPRHQEAMAAFDRLRVALNRGQVRAADPPAEASEGEWTVQAWVKQGILLGFRLGELVELPAAPGFRFFDKHTLPTRHLTLADQVRLVPGGSSVRDGAYVAPGVICMPPMFLNIGAYVGAGTLIDSHVLVGSCAQIGSRVHLSAAAQIGGVLEPVNAHPVVIEDDVLVGGNCGVYEGTRVCRAAVLAAGVTLTRSTPVYDLVRECIYRGSEGAPLTIPPGAVVVPGARAVTRGKGVEWGLSLQAPVIVKYRDERTAAAVELEEWLR